jgi:superfamily II RNA helicase
MVKICPPNYPLTKETIYKPYFEKYPYSLSSFQKYAIEAIVEGQHILVTAHTGSGKTLPAEFAIEYFTQKKQKVIYTSPIKALSNQKFYEFSQKFPNISFGILTGDIKTNPEADVLIMTTEILLNSLYLHNHISSTNNTFQLFQMDFQNELYCVIFDEVHYINDPDRGKVWEETIMLLPKHIQMVMLSATLDNPEKFALWCETQKNNKTVYLSTTNSRVVPLTHYSFITCNQSLFKNIKDKQQQTDIKNTIQKLHIIQDSKGIFNEQNYQKISKTISLFHQKNHSVKRSHVLNSVTKYLVDNQMLPAICFILNRKQLEISAFELTTILLEDDSKIPYIINKECEQIIRKLPNYLEYIQLPEYQSILKLLEKGVAIHHAGIMPILREMVELLFAKGYIKILFATETFAVGINMPTKTVIFTDNTKFDGSNSRILYSHEYTQMAGRAGRRGIDTIGHVIHLSNLFKITDLTSNKNMLKGNPQQLLSKFKISYHLLLNLIHIGETNFSDFINKSMLQNTIDNELNTNFLELSKLQNELDTLSLSLNKYSTPIYIIQQYVTLQNTLTKSINKQKKIVEKDLQFLLNQYPTISKDLPFLTQYIHKQSELEIIQNNITNIEQITNKNIQTILDYLFHTNYLQLNLNSYSLTNKGIIASLINETHCLIFANLIHDKRFNVYSTTELVAIFSCFTNITISDDKKQQFPKCKLSSVNIFVSEINDIYNKQIEFENQKNINIGFDYSIQFDIMDSVINWCNCTNEYDCKLVIQELTEQKEIFLGEFIKAILKINNIANELINIANYLDDIHLLSILKEIPTLTLKYVATNQSLYI